MSLSDYSSDEGWEDEEAIVPEAIAKVEAKMKDTFSTRKLSSSSLVVCCPARPRAYFLRQGSDGAFWELAKLLGVRRRMTLLNTNNNLMHTFGT
jgi:hypothetical protein